MNGGKAFSWPLALVVMSVVAGVVVLAALGRDATALVTLVTAGLSALMYGRVEQVRHQVNGNTSRQLDLIEEALRVLAVTDPPTAESIRAVQSTMDGPQRTERESVGTQQMSTNPPVWTDDGPAGRSTRPGRPSM